MTSYTFIITDRKFDGYRKISSLLFIVNALTFFGIAFTPAYATSRTVFITGGLLLAAYAVYQWKWKKKGDRSYWLVYLLAAVIWATETPFYFFALLFILLLLLQLRMEKDARITISDAGVTVNRFLTTMHPWHEVQNLVLRDGLLTIDFSSNRLLQAEPGSFIKNGAEDLPPVRLSAAMAGTEEYLAFQQDFNEFCGSRLKHPERAVPKL